MCLQEVHFLMSSEEQIVISFMRMHLQMIQEDY